MTGYWTDGKNLYEFISLEAVRNAGLMGGVVSWVTLRDVHTGEVITVRLDQYADLRRLEIDEEAEVQKLHAALDDWARERPSWLR